jgi:hypothetical protein
MNLTSFTPTDTFSHEKAFLAEANKILVMQHEVNELQEQLDRAYHSVER